MLHLVEITPNINVQDEEGWTPLIFAAKTESPAVTKYLLLKGADTNLRVVNILITLKETGSHKHKCTIHTEINGLTFVPCF